MTSRLRWLVLSGLALVACGADESREPAVAGVLERPLLRLETLGDSSPTVRLVQRLAPSSDIAPWTTEAREAPIVVALESGEYALRFDSWGRKRIAIPGTYSSNEFNQVALQGVFPGVFAIRLKFTDSAGGMYESASMATINTQAVQTVLFELPRMQRQNRTWGNLELRANKGFKLFELHSLDLLHRPLSLALPRAGEDGRLITLDHSRQGVGVSTGEPVVCWVEPEAAAVLRFAYGLPPDLNAPDQRITLTVTLTGRDGSLVRPVSFELETAENSKWKQLSLPLKDFEGATEVRFEVSTSDGREAVCAVAEVSLLRTEENAPSVLLVTSDTHRADHLGAANSGLAIETPALDALAKRGVLFEDCYSSTNVTLPSHVALMTGMHPRDTHLVTNFAHLSEQAETLAERFRDAGYLTLAVVSAGQLGPGAAELGQGFDRMQAPKRGVWDAEVSVQHVTEWLADAEGIPVFVWLHLFDAHHPYAPPESYDRYYYPKKKDPFDASLPKLGFDPECIPLDLLAVRDLEFPKAQYRAEISYLDHELAQLFDHPRLQNGIFAVTADHGEVLEKSGSYFNHGSLYPDTLHIPLILAWPEASAGLRVERAVEQLDLGRTLLDLAGLASVSFPGTSLVADLEAPGTLASVPRFALSANGLSASLTTAEWHYILYLQAFKGSLKHVREQHVSELHNLITDPECLVDVAAEQPERAARFRRMLVAWLSDGSGADLTVSGQQSAASMEQLAALGYATAVEAAAEEWIDPECDCPFCTD